MGFNPTTTPINGWHRPVPFHRKQSTTPYEPQLVSADDSRQKRFTGQLDIYFDAVIACVRKVETLLIFGPGEAKGEFRKRIKKSGMKGRIEETETFGQMTDRQIAAHVRRYFQSIPMSKTTTKKNP